MDLPGGVVVEQGGGHLGPSGIVDADEEDFGGAGDNGAFVAGHRPQALGGEADGQVG